MILVDTSVVIDFAGKGREAGRPPSDAFRRRLRDRACGIACRRRDPKHRANLLTLLATFNHLAIPDSIWDDVGDKLAFLRSKGITVPLPDAVMATLGMENNLEVWSRDPHFYAMQKILPALKLYKETP